MPVTFDLFGRSQVQRFPFFNNPPYNAFLVDWNLFYRALISAHPTVELQLVTFHEEVSGSLSQSLVNVIKAGLVEMILVHAPAYQPGNFQKILVTLDQILCFSFWLLSLYPGSPCI